MGMYYDPVRGQWFPTSSVPSGGTTTSNIAYVDGSNNALVDNSNNALVIPGGILVTTRLTVTILADGSSDGATRRSECVQAAQMLQRVAAQLVSSETLTGTLTNSNGVATTSFVYTPTASA